MHLNGQPRFVCISGTNLPSKNLSNFPVKYGDGASDKFGNLGNSSVRNVSLLFCE